MGMEENSRVIMREKGKSPPNSTRSTRFLLSYVLIKEELTRISLLRKKN